MSAESGAAPSRYLAGGLSEKGRRSSNEDAAVVAVFPPPSALRAFAVLCDGMGGHNAGEVASRLAVEILKNRIRAFAARPGAAALPTRAEVEAEVRGWVDEVNREIHQRGKSNSAQKGMGTTLALAMVLADDRLVVANVGDSRVFLVSGLGVRLLSVDHTALAEQRRALGSDSVAPGDDAENPFAHAITRSLGQENTVEPDVRSDVVLQPGDTVVLTTDGVTDVLEAERFLTALETSGSLDEAAEEIHRLAFDAGSKDNISVALISRGTPARLGLSKEGYKAGAEDGAEHLRSASSGMLIAGAASGPGAELPLRSGRGRLVAFGAAAFALVLVAVGVGVLYRRPEPPRPATAVPAAPPAAPASQPAAPAPADTPILAAPSPPAPAPPTQPAMGPGPETRPALQPPSRSLPPPASEPAPRPPVVLTGPKPLEFPPTPTATHTPQPPTPSPTPAASTPPSSVPAAVPAPPVPAPADTPPPPAPSPTSAAPARPTFAPYPAPAPRPGLSG